MEWDSSQGAVPFFMFHSFIQRNSFHKNTTIETCFGSNSLIEFNVTVVINNISKGREIRL